MILIGTTTNQCVVSHTGSFPELVSFGRSLAYWAIFWDHLSHGQFHNATDDRYLVAHWRDPFWLNCGFLEQYDYNKAPTRSIHETAEPPLPTYKVYIRYIGKTVFDVDSTFISVVDAILYADQAFTCRAVEAIQVKKEEGGYTSVLYDRSKAPPREIEETAAKPYQVSNAWYYGPWAHGLHYIVLFEATEAPTHQSHSHIVTIAYGPFMTIRQAIMSARYQYDYTIDYLDEDGQVIDIDNLPVVTEFPALEPDFTEKVVDRIIRAVYPKGLRESTAPYQPLLIDATDHKPTGRKAQRRSVDRTMAKIRKLHEDLNAALYTHPTERPKIHSPQDAVQVLTYFLTGLDHEEFWVLNLDTRNRISHFVSFQN